MASCVPCSCSLQCLWVEHLGANVDLEARPLTVLRSRASHAPQCALPRGGQAPVPEGQDPHVSFILTMHNNAVLTAQCLLELFR